MNKSLDIHVSYKLSRARSHVQKAKKLLSEIELLNSKVEGDFYAIDNFCKTHEMNLKREDECRVDNHDQR